MGMATNGDSQPVLDAATATPTPTAIIPMVPQTLTRTVKQTVQTPDDAPPKIVTTQTELKLGENQISGPVASIMVVGSLVAFFLGFIGATGMMIWRSYYLTLHPELLTNTSIGLNDILRDIALGSGAILATIIIGNQVLTAFIGRFIK